MVVVKKAIEKKSLMLENIYLSQKLQEKYGFHNIVGKSKKVQEIYRIIAKVTMTDSNHPYPFYRYLFKDCQITAQNRS